MGIRLELIGINQQYQARRKFNMESKDFELAQELRLILQELVVSLED